MHLEALKKGHGRRQLITRPLFPAVLLDLPTKGSPENPQKYFQKVTFFKGTKTTTQITTKKTSTHHVFATRNHAKNAQKRATPL